MALPGETGLKTLFPAPLAPGDIVAISAPAGRFDHSLLPPAVERLEAEGFRVHVMPHCLDVQGTYAGSVADRLADMRAALTDPAVRAVICARGGYGAVQLLQGLSDLPLRSDPKWLVGFSDITALHALFARAGVASLHAPMLKAFSADDSLPMETILRLLSTTEGISYRVDPHPLNRPGVAEATIVGGNLSVMAALTGTPFNMIKPGRVLFIEDINEPVYKVERILWQLRLSGVLEHLAGLVVGRFTGYAPDANHQSMEQMISEMVDPYGYPVLYNAPIGHIPANMPVIEGARCRLDVSETPTLALAR